MRWSFTAFGLGFSSFFRPSTSIGSIDGGLASSSGAFAISA